MTTEVRTSTWSIDPTHSSAEFAVKHLMVATVKGRFREIGGKLHIDEEQPQNSWVEARIAAASIETGLAERDAHLRSDDFLNTEAFPDITFRSTGVRRLAGDRLLVKGDLTIRDITREVELETQFEGEARGFGGRREVAFTAETSISRRDFGLKYNAIIEGGTIVVADKVKITLSVAAVLE
jgi:polyisoprenoid-binding protein YceI